MANHPPSFFGHDEKIVDIPEGSLSHRFGFSGVPALFDPISRTEKIGALRKELIETLGLFSHRSFTILEVLHGAIHRGLALAMKEPQDTCKNQPKDARNGGDDLSNHAIKRGLFGKSLFLGFHDRVSFADHRFESPHLLDQIQISIAELSIGKFQLLAGFAHHLAGHCIRCPDQFTYLTLDLLAMLLIPTDRSVSVEVLVHLNTQLSELGQRGIGCVDLGLSNQCFQTCFPLSHRWIGQLAGRGAIGLSKRLGILLDLVVHLPQVRDRFGGTLIIPLLLDFAVAGRFGFRLDYPLEPLIDRTGRISHRILNAASGFHRAQGWLVELAKPMGFSQSPSILSFRTKVTEPAILEHQSKNRPVILVRDRMDQLSVFGLIAEPHAQGDLDGVDPKQRPTVGSDVVLPGGIVQKNNRPMRCVLGQPSLQFPELAGAHSDISLDIQVTIRTPRTEHILNPFNRGES